MGNNQTKEFLLAAERGQTRQVKLLLKQGVFPNVYDERTMRTALQLAARGGFKDLVDLLLQSGADPKMKDKSGKSALHYAVAGRRTSIAESLMVHGAELSGDTAGSSPIHIAAGIGDEALLWLLIKNALSVGGSDRNGRTPLHHAVGSGNLACTALLLLRGSSEDLIDDNAKKLARKGGHAQCSALLDFSDALFYSLNPTIAEVVPMANLDQTGESSSVGSAEHTYSGRYASIQEITAQIDHVLGGASSLLTSENKGVRLWASWALSRIADKPEFLSRLTKTISFVIRALDSLPFFGSERTNYETEKSDTTTTTSSSRGIFDLELSENLLNILCKVAETGSEKVKEEIVREIDWDSIMRLALSETPSIRKPAQNLLDSINISASQIAIDCLKTGDTLFKVRRRAGGIHDLLFRLEREGDSVFMQWVSENKKLSKSRISMDTVREIRLGQSTVGFRKNVKQLTQLRLKTPDLVDKKEDKAQPMNKLSFSVIYADSKGKEQSLDLIANNEYQYAIWTTALLGCVGKTKKKEVVVEEKEKEEVVSIEKMEEKEEIHQEEEEIDIESILNSVRMKVSDIEGHIQLSERRLDSQSRQARVLVAVGREDEARLCLRYARIHRLEIDRGKGLVTSITEASRKLQRMQSKENLMEIETLCLEGDQFIQAIDQPSAPENDMLAEEEISNELKALTSRVQEEKVSMRVMAKKDNRSSSLPVYDRQNVQVPPKPKFLIGAVPRASSPLVVNVEETPEISIESTGEHVEHQPEEEEVKETVEPIYTEPPKEQEIDEIKRPDSPFVWPSEEMERVEDVKHVLLGAPSVPSDPPVQIESEEPKVKNDREAVLV